MSVPVRAARAVRTAPPARTATVVRWHARSTGRPPLLVAENVRPWAPAAADPAAVEALPPPMETPSAWTADLVRGRLAEAMATLRRLPEDAHARPSTTVVRWPDVVRDIAEAYGYDRARTRMRPTPAEIGRLDATLPWLFLIENGQQRLAVIGVAMGLNLRVIGRTFGCSHETVRQRERAGIDALVRALNDGR